MKAQKKLTAAEKRALSNGYILHLDPVAKIVVIATGVIKPSANTKTGPMIQVWILCSDVNPVEAIKRGLDSRNCFTCIHRGEMRIVKGKRVWIRKRSCYVNVGQAPQQVFKSFIAGIYPFLPIEDFPRVFGERAVRLGAYGDPAAIPQMIVEAICAVAIGHTGYSHEWQRAEWLRPFVMASCDTTADFIQAKHHGWRTFRVTRDTESPQDSEILCPASEEAGKRTQCIKCGLCNGASEFKRDIFIPAHGSGKKNVFAILN